MLFVEFAVHEHPDNARQSAWFNKLVHTHACDFGVTVVCVAVRAIRIARTISAFITMIYKIIIFQKQDFIVIKRLNAY